MGRKGRIAAVLLIAVAVIILILAVFLSKEPELWGYARAISEEEKLIRDRVVATAENWLGANEQDGTHQQIIDLYNSHTPLARGYEVKYEDAWCSTFVSAVAIQCQLTDIIPTECGCERHIELFAAENAWEERDGYLPLPGDYIFYHWNCTAWEDCTHWSDHVGIVVGTWHNWIKVIEGNHNEAVGYRWLLAGDRNIRGYGVPPYGS